MEIVRENIHFERGLDPKRSMKIGLRVKRNFDSDEELIQWILDFPDEVTDGLFTSWDPSKMVTYWSEEHKKNFYNFSDFQQQKGEFSKLMMVKWIKNNIYMNTKYGEYQLGLKEAKDIADVVCQRIYEKGVVEENLHFERGLDPKKAMGLGTYEKIREWMDEVGVGIKNFSVKEDFSIDTDMDIIATERPELFPGGEFPSYLKFNTSGSFDVDACELNSLVGCPRRVKGYFSCQQNNLTTLQGFPRWVDDSVYCFGNEVKFTENEIREVCTSKEVQADDTDD